MSGQGRALNASVSETECTREGVHAPFPRPRVGRSYSEREVICDWAAGWWWCCLRMAAAVGLNKQTNAASMEPCVRHGRGTTGSTVKVRALSEGFEPRWSISAPCSHSLGFPVCQAWKRRNVLYQPDFFSYPYSSSPLLPWDWLSVRSGNAWPIKGQGPHSVN